MQKYTTEIGGYFRYSNGGTANMRLAENGNGNSGHEGDIPGTGNGKGNGKGEPWLRVIPFNPIELAIKDTHE